MKIPKAKKLPSGSWFCRVRVGGRDIAITRPTEKEAVAAALAMKAGIVEEQRNPLSITLANAFSRYIEVKSGVLSPSTIAGYDQIRRNALPGIMPLRLSALTNEKIQREITVMAKAGKSPKYIANVNGLLSAVLKMYYPDFVLRVTLPPKQKAPQRAITDSEIDAILSAVHGTDMELPVLMALWLGMRVSEIRGARVGDIVGDKLHICRAVVEDIHRRPTEKPPKTFSGDRWVNLPPEIKSLIPPSKRPEEHIVTLSGQAIYKRFSRLCENLNIPHCRFHDLRHANAAVMIRLGIESKYAQARNGWASDYMYKQVYGYAMPDKTDKNAAAIDAYFGNKMATAIQKSSN